MEVNKPFDVMELLNSAKECLFRAEDAVVYCPEYVSVLNKCGNLLTASYNEIQKLKCQIHGDGWRCEWVGYTCDEDIQT